MKIKPKQLYNNHKEWSSGWKYKKMLHMTQNGKKTEGNYLKKVEPDGGY